MLELRDVARRYGDVVALDGISFSVEEALAVLLRRTLELDAREWARVATVEDTTDRKERQ